MGAIKIMGRHKKTVMTDEGVDRRENGYYSTPHFVTEFITTELLNLNESGRTVFDPCIGKEEMASAFKRAGKAVTGWDIEDFGVHEVAEFEQRDFLSFYGEKKDCCILGQKPELSYDYYVANPPYNCHESNYIRANKKRLQHLFPQIGVANMYSMFLSAMIDIAKPGAVLGIITNDSFLTSRMHEELRKHILSVCRITHLLLCPVDLFWKQRADVRTCIIILVKEQVKTDYELKVLNRPENIEKFKKTLSLNMFAREIVSDLVLRSEQDRHEFVIGCPKSIRKLFNLPRLSQKFRCVTGISTGNDKKYLRKNKDSYYSIPFYKNPGMRRFWMEPDGYLPSDFLEIDTKVSNFMVRNKDLLYKEGISCSSMGIPFGACALPSGSTYGVNANIFCEHEDRYWLLSYLNSSLVTYLVKGILLRTNMITSGYVSRIPLVSISTQGKAKLEAIAEKAVEQKIQKAEYIDLIKKIDEIIFTESGIPESEINLVRDFCENIMKRT